MLTRALTLRAQIAAHPWDAVGIAFALGAIVAFDRSGAARQALLAAIRTAALGTMREAVERRWGHAPLFRAPTWQNGPNGGDGGDRDDRS